MTLPEKRLARQGTLQRDLNTLIDHVASIGGGGATDHIENASSEGVYVDADGTVTVILGDSAGVEKLVVQDKGGAVVAYLDSDGNIQASGAVLLKKIAAPGPTADHVTLYTDTADAHLYAKVPGGTAYRVTHNLGSDIDHNALTNTHNLTTHINHASITGAHNLTTDINHDALTNFVANEHIDWTNAASNFKTSGTVALLSALPKSTWKHTSVGAPYANYVGFVASAATDPNANNYGTLDVGIYHDDNNMSLVQFFLNEFQFVVQKAGSWYFPLTGESAHVFVNGQFTVVLTDAAGVSQVTIKDSGGNEVASIDSDGNIQADGGLDLGTATGGGAGDVRYSGDLEPLRSGAYYTGKALVLAGYAAKGSDAELTTSWVDMVSVTQTVPAGTLVFNAAMNVQNRNTTGAAYAFRLVVDGSVVATIGGYLPDIWENPTVPLTWAGSIGAGSKTWKVQGSSSSDDATHDCYCSASSHVSWQVFT